MRVPSFATLAILASGTWAQTTFEPADFNVTEALLEKGVNVSALPQLEGLVERSLLSGCSIAVCIHVHRPSSLSVFDFSDIRSDTAV
jgi:hypothetical protein